MRSTLNAIKTWKWPYLSLVLWKVWMSLYFLPLWAWFLTDRWSTKKEKMLLTRGAEGGSQCWRAWGQATLRMRSRGRWRRGRGGWRGRGGGGASSRQGGRRGGQPLSRLHICQTQSNQQGYNSKAHPSVHLKHTCLNTHTDTHTHQWILSHLHSRFKQLQAHTHLLTLLLSHLTSPEQYFYLAMLAGFHSSIDSIRGKKEASLKTLKEEDKRSFWVVLKKPERPENAFRKRSCSAQNSLSRCWCGTFGLAELAKKKQQQWNQNRHFSLFFALLLPETHKAKSAIKLTCKPHLANRIPLHSLDKKKTVISI